MAWITTEDVYEKWIEAVDDNGETLGFIRPSEARRLDIRILTIEKPQKFYKDSYVNYHAEILIRSGVITSGRDLNEVQTVLLMGYLINEKKNEADTRQADFEQLLFSNNPEMYKSYKEQEEQRKLVENPEYQQVRPKSLNELLAMFETFDSESNEVLSDSDEKKKSGWLDDMLNDTEINQIRD